MGRRGPAVRPGRGHPAADAAGGGPGQRDQPDLRHPLPRRPLPGAAGRTAADGPGPGGPRRRVPLSGRRAGVLQPSAARRLLPRRGHRHRTRGRGRPGRAGGDERLAAAGPAAVAPGADRGLPAGRAGRAPDAAGPAGRPRHQRAGRGTAGPRRWPGRGGPASQPGRGERAPGRAAVRVHHGHPALRRRVRAGRGGRPGRVRGDVPGRRGRAGPGLRAPDRAAGGPDRGRVRGPHAGAEPLLPAVHPPGPAPVRRRSRRGVRRRDRGGRRPGPRPGAAPGSVIGPGVTGPEVTGPGVTSPGVTGPGQPMGWRPRTGGSRPANSQPPAAASSGMPISSTSKLVTGTADNADRPPSSVSPRK